MVTEVQNGGAAITSYEVNWDAGTSGQVWTELFGYTTALATPYYIAQGLTMGRRYRFKIRAQNVHGWGPYSDVGEVLVATAADQMGLIEITENSDQTVKLAWPLPTENGAPVSSYKIKVRAKDGINYFESTFCNAADPSISASRQCNIPMIAFRQLPFLLEQGDLIVAIG